jgi:hypothetical protein
MGREFGISWDSATSQLLLHSPKAGQPVSRFDQEAPDRWRGRSGDEIGEVLEVVRDSGGTVTGLVLATYQLRRDPLADQ